MPGLAEVVAVRRLDAPSDRARVAELADEEARMGAAARRRRRRGPGRSCRPPCPCRRGSRTRRAPRARPSRSGPRCRASSGERTFWTSVDLRDRARRRPRSRPSKAGSPAASERLWIRTLSPAGCLKPASRILSMRPDSPGPAVFGSMLFVPTMPPSAKATRTKASQPKVAVFQWPALQRPMRAARLFELVRSWCGTSLLLLGVCRTACLDARSAAARRRRREAAIRARTRPTIPAPTQVGGGARERAVRSAREPARIPRAQVRVRRADRARWRSPACSRSSSGATRRTRRRTTLWFAVPAIAVLVLPLLARRRFPFAAPAAFWLLAAALSFVDGRLVPFMPASSSSGMAAAFLLGNLRDAVQARIGLAIVARRRGDRRLQQPEPRGRRARLHPAPVRDRLARRLRAARAGRAGRGGGGARDPGRAGARGGGAHRGRRGARADRARAPRHRRPRRQRDGAPGRRRPAQAPRRARRGRGRAPGRRAGRPHGARRDAPPPRRDAPRRRRRSSSRPSRASTASTRCWTRSAAPAFPCGCTSTASPFPLPRAIDLSAYRIVQEGLTNALKHARASHADVTVRYRPDELQIEVRDDGDGRRDERRPRPRARRHPRARQDLRRRDDRGNGDRTAASSSARASRSAASGHDDPRPRRRRPVDGPRRLSHAARRRGGHRGRGRGEQRARGGREGGALSTRPSS